MDRRDDARLPVMNLLLNGANMKMVGAAYAMVAEGMNKSLGLRESVETPVCLSYIYPNAKRLVWQQRLTAKVLNAQRNKKKVFYCTNRFWGMREMLTKVMLERWIRLFESFTNPPMLVNRPTTYLFPEEAGIFQKSSKGTSATCAEANAIAAKSGSGAYILKPVDLACGRGIEIVTSREDVLKTGFTRNAIGKGGTELVVQEYVDNPLLFENRKFDLRLYVLITEVSNNNLEYLFDRRWCFARLAGSKYSVPSSRNVHDTTIHLSNTTQYADKSDVKRSAEEVLQTIRDQQLNGTYGQESHHEWICTCGFSNHAGKPKCRNTRCKKENPSSYGKDALDIEGQWENIENLLFATIHACTPNIALHYQNLFPQTDNETADDPDHCFQVLGFDVMLTQTEAYLIEVNANASFALETELDQEIKLDVLRQAFLTKTKLCEKRAASFKTIAHSFKNAEMFFQACFDCYQKLSTLRLRKPTSELAPLERSTVKAIRSRLIETCHDYLPPPCITQIENGEVFRAPVSFFSFIDSMKDILCTLESTGVNRDQAMALLWGILNDLMSLCNDLRGTAVNAIPVALEVTRFGWAQRKIKQSAVSPRLSPRMGGRVLSASLNEVGVTNKK
jgi:hypothetical protein